MCVCGRWMLQLKWHRQQILTLLQIQCQYFHTDTHSAARLCTSVFSLFGGFCCCCFFSCRGVWECFAHCVSFLPFVPPQNKLLPLSHPRVSQRDPLCARGDALDQNPGGLAACCSTAALQLRSDAANVPFGCFYRRFRVINSRSRLFFLLFQVTSSPDEKYKYENRHLTWNTHTHTHTPAVSWHHTLKLFSSRTEPPWHNAAQLHFCTSLFPSLLPSSFFFPFPFFSLSARHL